MSYELICRDCIEYMADQPDDKFGLIFGSPPYCDARTYGIDAHRGCQEWIDWMLNVTTAAARICTGPVIWVVAGVTRDRNYWPACEGLMYEWWKRGGTHQLYRPCIFHRVGIPGSGGKDWFRADWEYVLCFKRPGKLAWSDNTAMGHPPKNRPGGAPSHRTKGGKRVGDARPHTTHRPNGTTDTHVYSPPELANPGNVIHCLTGGGLMGHPLAHENEAPMPKKLAEWFILSCCPVGVTVLDPFCGSGTTLDAAESCGRNSVGIDVRESQIELCKARLAQRKLF